MCSNESPPPSKEPLAVSFSISNTMAGFLPGLEQYRLQLYHYAMAERIRMAQHLHPQHPQHTLGQQSTVPVGQQTSAHLNIGHGYPAPLPLYPTGATYPRGLALSMALLHPHHQHIPEEPKPQHSYIGLIAMAILSSPEKKLVLSDIYQHILENYPYFRRRGPGWRNSIRHNLSLNDCFVKSGRSANGKGHYWAIHPANIEDFRRGDFRRRKAQRKVRRHMGLAVEEEPDSPSPPPLPTSPPHTSSLGTPISCHQVPALWTQQQNQHEQQQLHQQQQIPQLSQDIITHAPRHTLLQPSRKRQFDVASLLAPDDQRIETTMCPRKLRQFSYSEDEHEQEHDPDNEQNEDVDVEVDVEVDSQLKITNNEYDWRNDIETEDRQFSLIHLPNQVHLKDYYRSANTNASSNV